MILQTRGELSATLRAGLWKTNVTRCIGHITCADDEVLRNCFLIWLQFAFLLSISNSLMGRGQQPVSSRRPPSFSLTPACPHVLPDSDTLISRIFNVGSANRATLGEPRTLSSAGALNFRRRHGTKLTRQSLIPLVLPSNQLGI